MSREAELEFDTPIGPRSKLLDRVNGFMLGCFLASLRFERERRRYVGRRRRILEFFHDLHGDPPGTRAPASFLPVGRRALEAVVDERTRGIHDELGLIGLDLRNFFWLGSVAFTDGAVRARRSAEAIEGLRSRAIAILDHHGGDGRVLYDEFLARVRASMEEAPPKGNVAIRFEQVFTPALSLLLGGIEMLRADRRACFVAMAFRPSRARHFLPFLRPLARQFGCHAFRMWGDIGGEQYVELMLAILRRCGRVVADVSGLNANVAYEVGVARGLGKRITVVCERGLERRVPANIASEEAIFLYEPGERGWPELAVHRVAMSDACVALGRRAEQQEAVVAQRR